MNIFARISGVGNTSGLSRTAASTCGSEAGTALPYWTKLVMPAITCGSRTKSMKACAASGFGASAGIAIMSNQIIVPSDGIE